MQFDTAINEFSAALKLVKDPTEKALLLWHRCDAFLGYEHPQECLSCKLSFSLADTCTAIINREARCIGHGHCFRSSVLPGQALYLTPACARRMCQTLRGIPAAVSEHEALYGLDPMALAQLALKDASKAVEMAPDWPRVHLLQVSSLQRLGRSECSAPQWPD